MFRQDSDVSNEDAREESVKLSEDDEEHADEEESEERTNEVDVSHMTFEYVQQTRYWHRRGARHFNSPCRPFIQTWPPVAESEVLPNDVRSPWVVWYQHCKNCIHGTFTSDDHMRYAFLQFPFSMRKPYIDESTKDYECYLNFKPPRENTKWDDYEDDVKWAEREPASDIPILEPHYVVEPLDDLIVEKAMKEEKLQNEARKETSAGSRDKDTASAPSTNAPRIATSTCSLNTQSRRRAVNDVSREGGTRDAEGVGTDGYSKKADRSDNHDNVSGTVNSQSDNEADGANTGSKGLVPGEIRENSKQAIEKDVGRCAFALPDTASTHSMEISDVQNGFVVNTVVDTEDQEQTSRNHIEQKEPLVDKVAQNLASSNEVGENVEMKVAKGVVSCDINESKNKEKNAGLRGREVYAHGEHATETRLTHFATNKLEQMGDETATAAGVERKPNDGVREDGENDGINGKKEKTSAEASHDGARQEDDQKKENVKRRNDAQVEEDGSDEESCENRARRERENDEALDEVDGTLEGRRDKIQREEVHSIWWTNTSRISSQSLGKNKLGMGEGSTNGENSLRCSQTRKGRKNTIVRKGKDMEESSNKNNSQQTHVENSTEKAIDDKDEARSEKANVNLTEGDRRSKAKEAKEEDDGEENGDKSDSNNNVQNGDQNDRRKVEYSTTGKTRDGEAKECIAVQRKKKDDNDNNSDEKNVRMKVNDTNVGNSTTNCVIAKENDNGDKEVDDDTKDNGDVDRCEDDDEENEASEGVDGIEHEGICSPQNSRVGQGEKDGECKDESDKSEVSMEDGSENDDDEDDEKVTSDQKGDKDKKDKELERKCGDAEERIEDAKTISKNNVGHDEEKGKKNDELGLNAKSREKDGDSIKKTKKNNAAVNKDDDESNSNDESQDKEGDDSGKTDKAKGNNAAQNVDDDENEEESDLNVENQFEGRDNSEKTKENKAAQKANKDDEDESDSNDQKKEANRDASEKTKEVDTAQNKDDDEKDEGSESNVEYEPEDRDNIEKTKENKAAQNADDDENDEGSDSQVEYEPEDRDNIKKTKENKAPQNADDEANDEDSDSNVESQHKNRDTVEKTREKKAAQNAVDDENNVESDLNIKREHTDRNSVKKTKENHAAQNADDDENDEQSDSNVKRQQKDGDSSKKTEKNNVAPNAYDDANDEESGLSFERQKKDRDKLEKMKEKKATQNEDDDENENESKSNLGSKEKDKEGMKKTNKTNVVQMKHYDVNHEEPGSSFKRHDMDRDEGEKPEDENVVQEEEDENEGESDSNVESQHEHEGNDEKSKKNSVVLLEQNGESDATSTKIIHVRNGKDDQFEETNASQKEKYDKVKCKKKAIYNGEKKKDDIDDAHAVQNYVQETNGDESEKNEISEEQDDENNAEAESDDDMENRGNVHDENKMENAHSGDDNYVANGEKTIASERETEKRSGNREGVEEKGTEHKQEAKEDAGTEENDSENDEEAEAIVSKNEAGESGKGGSAGRGFQQQGATLGNIDEHGDSRKKNDSQKNNRVSNENRFTRTGHNKSKHEIAVPDYHSPHNGVVARKGTSTPKSKQSGRYHGTVDAEPHEMACFPYAPTGEATSVSQSPKVNCHSTGGVSPCIKPRGETLSHRRCRTPTTKTHRVTPRSQSPYLTPASEEYVPSSPRTGDADSIPQTRVTNSALQDVDAETSAHKRSTSASSSSGDRTKRAKTTVYPSSQSARCSKAKETNSRAAAIDVDPGLNSSVTAKTNGTILNSTASKRPRKQCVGGAPARVDGVTPVPSNKRSGERQPDDIETPPKCLPAFSKPFPPVDRSDTSGKLFPDSAANSQANSTALVAVESASTHKARDTSESTALVLAHDALEKIHRPLSVRPHRAATFAEWHLSVTHDLVDGEILKDPCVGEKRKKQKRDGEERRKCSDRVDNGDYNEGERKNQEDVEGSGASATQSSKDDRKWWITGADTKMMDVQPLKDSDTFAPSQQSKRRKTQAVDSVVPFEDLAISEARPLAQKRPREPSTVMKKDKQSKNTPTKSVMSKKAKTCNVAEEKNKEVVNSVVESTALVVAAAQEGKKGSAIKGKKLKEDATELRENAVPSSSKKGKRSTVERDKSVLAATKNLQKEKGKRRCPSTPREGEEVAKGSKMGKTKKCKAHPPVPKEKDALRNEATENMRESDTNPCVPLEGCQAAVDTSVEEEQMSKKGSSLKRRRSSVTGSEMVEKQQTSKKDALGVQEGSTVTIPTQRKDGKCASASKETREASNGSATKRQKETKDRSASRERNLAAKNGTSGRRLRNETVGSDAMVNATAEEQRFCRKGSSVSREATNEKQQKKAKDQPELREAKEAVGSETVKKQPKVKKGPSVTRDGHEATGGVPAATQMKDSKRQGGSREGREAICGTTKEKQRKGNRCPSNPQQGKEALGDVTMVKQLKGKKSTSLVRGVKMPEAGSSPTKQSAIASEKKRDFASATTESMPNETILVEQEGETVVINTPTKKEHRQKKISSTLSSALRETEPDVREGKQGKKIGTRNISSIVDDESISSVRTPRLGRKSSKKATSLTSREASYSSTRHKKEKVDAQVGVSVSNGKKGVNNFKHTRDLDGSNVAALKNNLSDNVISGIASPCRKQSRAACSSADHGNDDNVNQAKNKDSPRTRGNCNRDGGFRAKKPLGRRKKDALDAAETHLATSGKADCATSSDKGLALRKRAEPEKFSGGAKTPQDTQLTGLRASQSSPSVSTSRGRRREACALPRAFTGHSECDEGSQCTGQDKVIGAQASGKGEKTKGAPRLRENTKQDGVKGKSQKAMKRVVNDDVVAERGVPVDGDCGESSGDEICCVVCQSGDFTEDNDILLCDECDLGYHQSCCNPPVKWIGSPDDDWFCPGCTEKLCAEREFSFRVGQLVWYPSPKRPFLWPGIIEQVDFVKKSDTQPYRIRFFGDGGANTWAEADQLYEWSVGLDAYQRARADKSISQTQLFVLTKAVESALRIRAMIENIEGRLVADEPSVASSP